MRKQSFSLLLIKRFTIAFIAIVLFSMGNNFPESAQALTRPIKYPKIGNYYLKAGNDITSRTISQLARYDLLILPVEAQVQNPTMFTELRKINPNIVLLAYVPTRSFNTQYWHDTLHDALKKDIDASWWLRNEAGNEISLWPGTKALSVASDWSDYLATFVARNVISSGVWDGVFFDEVDDCVSCHNNGDIDLNHDRVRDNAGVADVAWRAGYVRLLSQTRSRIGKTPIIITNGSSHPALRDYENGRFFESFPTPWFQNGNWQDSESSYLNLEKTVTPQPPVVFLGSDTRNTGKTKEYDQVRFGLTSTLMGGGYFGYDFGTEDHGQLLWYDEYSVSLGSPTSVPRDVVRDRLVPLIPSVWRRDFERGLVLVNALPVPQTIDLHGDYEKLHGTQDTVTNDGSIISTISLSPQDGVILRRITNRIIGTSFPNGAFSRIVNADGAVVRTGFFTYDAHAKGGEQVILINQNHDGNIETITTNGGRVELWDSNNALITTFAPYGNNFPGPLSIAVGDVTGDDATEIITGAGTGGPHVRIWSFNGTALGPGFFSGKSTGTGGVTVATADTNKDGKAEIITGAGPGGLPTVRIYNAVGRLISPEWNAYAPTFHGGVRVTAADLNGDGTSEIITGAGPGGAPHVRIFNTNGIAWNRGFYAYDSHLRTGVSLGTADLDGDGTIEIFAYSNLP